MCTNGGFDPETTAKRVHQFFEIFVTVFKSMTKHQGADDVGDDVVEHEMRSKGSAYSCKQKKNHLIRILAVIPHYQCVSLRSVLAFEISKAFGAVCVFLQYDRLQRL